MAKLNDIAEVAFETASDKGWWDVHRRAGRRDDVPSMPGLSITPTELIAQLALVGTEVSEAIEAVRDGDYSERLVFRGSMKPEGLPSELADIVIRVAQLAHALGVDLDGSVERKMAYNDSRSLRHGGKLL